MKKIVIIIAAFIFSANFVCADTPPTEQDYKNMDELRVKLMRMRREMDKFMKDVVGSYPDQTIGGANIFGQDVKVDIAQTVNDIIVKADLPGMDKDKIDITLESGKVLKLSGSRDAVKKETSPGVIKQERMSGRFERVLELPAECLGEGIKATYKSGVLEIIIPKKKVSKEEMVKISVQ